MLGYEYNFKAALKKSNIINAMISFFVNDLHSDFVAVDNSR